MQPTPAKVLQSVALVRNSRLSITRVTPAAKPLPITAPASANLSPCPAISRTISPSRAPSACLSHGKVHLRYSLPGQPRHPHARHNPDDFVPVVDSLRRPEQNMPPDRILARRILRPETSCQTLVDNHNRPPISPIIAVAEFAP